jgi:hypothetical protein
MQLKVENALAEFIAQKNISELNAAKIYAGHARNKIAPDTRGTYLGIIADSPAWEEMIVNATLKVKFELATGGINDHDRAAALALAHQVRVDAIIEIFSDQKYAETKAALNQITDEIQFIGWEAEKPGEDGTSEDGIQLITRLPYVFDVFQPS